MGGKAQLAAYAPTHPTPLRPSEPRQVGLRKYASVRRGTFGMDGKKRIAVLRANGAILGEGRGGGGGGWGAG
jgi:hypothetical protein